MRKTTVTQKLISKKDYFMHMLVESYVHIMEIFGEAAFSSFWRLLISIEKKLRSEKYK